MRIETDKIAEVIAAQRRLAASLRRISPETITASQFAELSKSIVGSLESTARLLEVIAEGERCRAQSSNKVELS